MAHPLELASKITDNLARQWMDGNLFLKPMIHGSTFVEQQICPTNVEQCIMYCWMLKYAIQHVERYINRIELESIPFNKLPLIERRPPIVFEFGVTRLAGNIQHGDWNCGCVGMELSECVNMGLQAYAAPEYVVSELCQESVVCPERGPIF